jgi:hypothetical protein
MLGTITDGTTLEINRPLPLNFHGFPEKNKDIKTLLKDSTEDKRPTLPYTLYFDKNDGKNYMINTDGCRNKEFREDSIPYELPLGIRILDCAFDTTYNFNYRENYISSDNAIPIFNGINWCYMTSVFLLLYNCLNITVIQFLFKHNPAITDPKLLPVIDDTYRITSIYDHYPNYENVDDKSQPLSMFDDPLWDELKKKGTDDTTAYNDANDPYGFLIYPENLPDDTPHPFYGKSLHSYSKVKVDNKQKSILYFLHMIKLYFQTQFKFENKILSSTRLPYIPYEEHLKDKKEFDYGPYQNTSGTNNSVKLRNESNQAITNFNQRDSESHQFLWYRIGLSCAMFEEDDDILAPNDANMFIDNLIDNIALQRNLYTMLIKENLEFTQSNDITFVDINNNAIIVSDINNIKLLSDDDALGSEKFNIKNILEDKHLSLLKLKIDEYDENHNLHQNVHISYLLDINKKYIGTSKYNFYEYYYKYLQDNNIDSNGNEEDKKIFSDNNLNDKENYHNYYNHVLKKNINDTNRNNYFKKIIKYIDFNEHRLLTHDISLEPNMFIYTTEDDANEQSVARYQNHTKYNFENNKHLIIDLTRGGGLLYEQIGFSTLDININMFYYHRNSNRFFYNPGDKYILTKDQTDAVDCFKLKGTAVGHASENTYVPVKDSAGNIILNGQGIGHYHYTSFDKDACIDYVLNDRRKTTFDDTTKMLDNEEYKMCRQKSVLLLYQKMDISTIQELIAADSEYKKIYDIHSKIGIDQTFEPLKVSSVSSPPKVPQTPSSPPLSPPSSPPSSPPPSPPPTPPPATPPISPTPPLIPTPSTLSTPVKSSDIKEYIKQRGQYIEQTLKTIYSDFQSKYKLPDSSQKVTWMSNSFMKSKISGGAMISVNYVNQQLDSTTHTNFKDLNDRLIHKLSSLLSVEQRQTIPLTNPTVQSNYFILNKNLRSITEITKDIDDEYSKVIDISVINLKSSDYDKKIFNIKQQMIKYYKELYDAYQVIQYNLCITILNNQMMMSQTEVSVPFIDKYTELLQIFDYVDKNLKVHTEYLTTNDSNLDTLIDNSLLFKLNKMDSAVITLIEEIQK